MPKNVFIGVFVVMLAWTFIAGTSLVYGQNAQLYVNENPAKKAPEGFIYGPDGKLHKINTVPADQLDAPDLIQNGFGTSEGIDSWYSYSDFIPESNASYSISNFYRYRLSGSTFFDATLQIPNGAYLTGLRFFYIDNDASNDVSFWFCRLWTKPSGGSPSSDCPYSASSTGSSTAGKSYWMPIGETILYRQDIDNDGIEEAVHYVIVFQLTGTNSNTKFRGVRAFWYRQVSPGPTAATFNDVPTTHPAFKYIEALVASGIVQGCGGGNYCPTQYVTRGQMAVFIAIALGLHWSPFYP